MSGEAVPYHLRQNKHVDRQLFIELLSHVDRVTPISKALYISFGGVFFEDFKLVHQVFGTRNLLSIEQLDWVHRRQRHNRPYGCVRCKKMTSRELVNSIDAIRGARRPHIVCWLDFADANKAARRSQLEDIEIFTKKATHLDVLRVTVNANPASLGAKRPAEEGAETIETLDQRRLEKLRNEFGDKLKREVDPADVSREGFPRCCIEMIKNAIHSGLKTSPDLMFQPLGAFTYADSQHTMLTLTGVFLSEKAADNFLRQTRIKKCEFASLTWQPIHINVPLLSLREKLLLDKAFGGRKGAAEVAADLGFQFDAKPEVSESMLGSYFQFHRYYPHFHRIHY